MNSETLVEENVSKNEVNFFIMIRNEHTTNIKTTILFNTNIRT